MFERRGRVPFTSDQAVVGLMADDIRERGAHPVFYYGSEYAGTLEPHYLALVFALFGSSPLVFRGAMAFLLALVVLAVWGATRAAFGERAGLLGGLYLAVGPSYFLYKGLSSDGAYASLLLLSALALRLMLATEERFARGEGAVRLVLALGLVLGLAWFVHSPAAFLGPVLAAAAFGGTPRRWLAPRALLLLVVAFLLGSAPWWVRNLETGMASLHSKEMAAAEAGRFASQVVSLFTEGWRVLLGAGSVWSWLPTFPGATAVALALLLVLLAFGAWSAARGPSPAARHGARVFVAGILSLSALCLMVSRTDFSEPRYLFAAYAAVAPLVGGLADAVWPRRLPRITLLAALLALNLGSELRAPRMKHEDVALGFFGEMDLTGALDWLRAQRVRSVYASYWAAYRLAFLSRGEIAASPLGSGTNGAARIAWLKTRVDADPTPGFLLRDDDLESFRAFLNTYRFARQREAFGGFVLFTGLPAEALRIVRRCGCIPTTVGPGEIVLSNLAGPDRMPARSLATYRVTVGNGSARRLSSNVHLAYHWLRPDGSVVVWDSARAPGVSWPLPGDEVEVEIEVRADVPPGEYDLAFDLVDEGVAWFESRNGPPKKRRVVVEPAAGG